MNLGPKILCTVLATSLVAGAGAAIAVNKQAQKVKQVTGSTYGMSYLRVEDDDKIYGYNNQVTAILYIGVDAYGDLSAPIVTDDITGEVISLQVVLLDNYHKDMKVLDISRDLITNVRTSNADTVMTQISNAYIGSDDVTLSCENVVNAVSQLLGGVPIQEYIVTNRDSVVKMNEIAGGITVTVPNDDVAGINPEFVKDAVVTLNSDNLLDFVTYTDDEVPFANAGRMEREVAFSSEFIRTMYDVVQADAIEIWDTYKQMKTYMQTSVDKNQYLFFVDLVSGLEIPEEYYYSIEGEYAVAEDGSEAFYADEDSLHELVLDLFYIEG